LWRLVRAAGREHEGISPDNSRSWRMIGAHEGKANLESGTTYGGMSALR